MINPDNILFSLEIQRKVFKVLPTLNPKSCKIVKVIHAVAKKILTFIAFIWVKIKRKEFYSLDAAKTFVLSDTKDDKKPQIRKLLIEILLSLYGTHDLPDVPDDKDSLPIKRKYNSTSVKFDDIADDEELWDLAENKCTNWEEYKKTLGDFKVRQSIPTFETRHAYDSKMMFHLFSDEAGANSAGYEGNSFAKTIPFIASYMKKYPAIEKKLKDAESLLPLTSERLREALKKLKPGESLLIPAGWSGNPSGHAMLYEAILEKDGTITLRYFNSGAGSNYHQVASVGLKDRSHAYVDLKGINKDKMSSEEVLRAIVEMDTAANNPQNISYNEDFIYGGLKDLLDPKHIELGPKNPTYKSKQRAGTCSLFVLKSYLSTQIPPGEFKQNILDLRLDYLRKIDLDTVPDKDFHMFKMAVSKTSRKLLSYQEKLGLISQEYVREANQILEWIQKEFIEPQSEIHVGKAAKIQYLSFSIYEGSFELDKLPNPIEKNLNNDRSLQASHKVGATLSCKSPLELTEKISSFGSEYEALHGAIELFCERVSLAEVHQWSQLNDHEIEKMTKALCDISKAYYTSSHAVPACVGAVHPESFYVIMKLVYMQKTLLGMKIAKNPLAYAFPSSIYVNLKNSVSFCSKAHQEEIFEMIKNGSGKSCDVLVSQMVVTDGGFLSELYSAISKRNAPRFEVSKWYASNRPPEWLRNFRDGTAYLGLIINHEVRLQNIPDDLELRYKVENSNGDSYTSIQVENKFVKDGNTAYNQLYNRAHAPFSHGLKALFEWTRRKEADEKSVIEADLSKVVNSRDFWDENELKAIARIFLNKNRLDFLIIDRQPVVIFTEALRYYTLNPERLSELDHQSVLEMTLFSPKLLSNFGDLEKKILSSFIEKQFKHNLRIGQFSNLLFYVRLSRHLQAFFPEDSVYSACVSELDQLIDNPLASVEVKSQAYLEKLAILSHRISISDDEAIEIFVAKTYLNENPIAPNVLNGQTHYEARLASHKHYEKMQQVLSQNSQKVMQRIMWVLRRKNDFDQVQFRNGLIESADQTFQFYPFEFYLKTAKHEAVLPEFIRLHPSFVRLFGSLEKAIFLAPGAYQIGDDCIYMKDAILHIERKIGNTLCRYASAEQFYHAHKKSYTFPGPLIKDFNLWVSIDPDWRKQEVFFTDSKNQVQFKANRNHITDDWEIRNKDDKKILRPILDFSPFERTDQILFYQDEVHLPRFGLVFKKEGTKWVTTSCGERWELDGQKTQFLEPFSTYLCVNSPNGKRKYLIPDLPFYPLPEHQAITLKHEMNPLIEFNDPSKCNFFIFNEDFRGGTTKGYLKLVEIFLVAGHYGKAIDFLKKYGKKAGDYTLEEQQALFNIATLTRLYNGDISGPALGTRIHALLYLIQKQGLDKTTEKELLPLYHQYLNHFNHTMFTSLSTKDELILIELILGQGFDAKTYRRLKRLNPERAKFIQIRNEELNKQHSDPEVVTFDESSSNLSNLYFVPKNPLDLTKCSMTQPLKYYYDHLHSFYRIARAGSKEEKDWLFASFKFAPHCETKENKVWMYAFHFLYAVAHNSKEFSSLDSVDNWNSGQKINEKAAALLKKMEIPSVDKSLKAYKSDVREFFLQEVPLSSEPSLPIPKTAINTANTTLAPYFEALFAKAETYDLKKGREELKVIFEKMKTGAKSSTEKKEWERLINDLEGKEADVREFIFTSTPDQLKAIYESLQKMNVPDFNVMEDELLTLANRSKSIKLDLERRGGLRRIITLEEIFYAYASGNGGALLKKNPGLDEQEIKKLFALAEHFLLLSTKEQQRKRALKTFGDLEMENDPEAKKELIHQLGQVLTAKRAYLENKPRYLVFEYFGDLLLREGQIKKIDQFIETGEFNLVVELIMGSGKSKVLMPLLALLRANGEKLSMLLVPEALFESVSSETREILYQTFNIELETITFNRNTNITPSNLRIIKDKLLDIQESRGSLMMTGRSVQSLLLKYIELWYKVEVLKNKSKEHLQSLELMTEILHILHSNGIPLLDEVDTLLDVLHEVNFSLGEILHPTKTDIQTISALYTILESQALPALMTEKMYNESYKAQILDQWIKQSGFEDTPLLRSYLLRSPENAREAQKYFDQLPAEKQDILALIAEELNQYLPHTLSRVVDENYGVSSEGGLATAIPFKASNIPSIGSEFANAHITMNYTLQNYLRKGVDKKLLKEEWIKLQTKARKEIVEKNIDLEQTESYIVFKSLVGDLNVPFFHFKEVHLDLLLNVINASTAQKIDFVSKVILPQIEIQSFKLSANSHHLAAFFKHLCGFTGTLHNGKSMHSKLTPKPALGTDALTLELLYRNQTAVQVVNNYQEVLSLEYSMIADAGGYFKEGGNAELAKETSLKKNKPVLFYTESGQVRIANGKDVVDYDPSKYPAGSFIAFLDQSRTTGADVKMPVNAVSINTIGPNTRLRDLLQTAWRLRGLQGNQRVVYVVTQEVEAVIRNELDLSKDHSITFEEILRFAVRNQAKTQQKNNLKAFLHEVQSIPQMMILEAMIDPKNDYQAKKLLFEQLSKYWIKKQGKPARELYGAIPEKVPAAKVFEMYLKKAEDEIKALSKICSVEVDWSKIQRCLQIQFEGYLPEEVELPLREIDDQEASVQKEVETDIMRDMEVHNDVQKPSIRLGKRHATKLKRVDYPSMNVEDAESLPYYYVGDLFKDDAIRYAFSDLGVCLNAFAWDRAGGEDQQPELLGLWRHPLKYLTFEKTSGEYVILSHTEVGSQKFSFIDTNLGRLGDGPFELTTEEQRMVVKTKFLNGEMDYTKDQQKVLEDWISQFGPKRMRKFFEEKLLVKAHQKDYPGSSLDQSFMKMVQAKA